MISYLEQLVETGEYDKALELGEQLLMSRESTENDLVAIQCSLLRAQCSLGKLDSALTTGQLCLELARDLHEWDYFGLACLYLGVAYARLHRHSEAVPLFAEYLDRLPMYTVSGKAQVMAWYNLGISYLKLDETKNAASALVKAHALAARAGSERTLHGIRQALIDAKLSTGDFASIPRLLAQCGRFLRQNPSGFMNRESWLHHVDLRARYAFSTKRLRRSKLLAVRGLEQASEGSEYPTFFHLLLAQIALSEELGVESLGHAIAAQICARNRQRPDLETSAAELVYTISRTLPNAFAEMDRFYLTS
ncbi:MAG TPA: hypothetical protein VD902_22430 [Symbiobacteriaceae bacterium]|nr:hypothetical protein [Symbiobacteriaceae bacterium]